MKISVITPSYNSAHFIETVIQSVEQQSYEHVEHIVIDGASTDETVSILQKYPHLKWVSEPDKGIYDAMNKGVAMATGDWIIFLGADDTFFDKETLAYLTTNYQQELQTNDIVYGDVVFKEWFRASHAHKKFSKYDFDTSNINHQAMFYSTKVFNKVGGYSLHYPVFADWEFNVRCFFNKDIRTQYVPLLIAYFSVEGVSNTRKDDFYTNKENYLKQVVAKNGKREQLLFELYKTPKTNFLKKISLKLMMKIWG